MPPHLGACCLALIFATWTAPVWAEEVTVSFASLGAAYMDHLVAIERGYMAEEGGGVEQVAGGKSRRGRALLRAIAKGREFARRYKEPAVAMVAKYNPLPAEALAVDYDSALVSMTEEGSVSDDVLRDEVAARAELIKAPKLTDLSKVFDYAIIRRVYGELKRTWKRKF
ncbi:MAG: hypothetical protein ACXWYM_24245 [Candidatus Binatia bacterium]